MSMGLLVWLLISIPFSNLLIFLIRTVLRLATPIIQQHARAHFTWLPGSRFLGDHHLPSRHTTPLNNDQFPPPCDINLSVAQYKSPMDSPSERVECIFCLSSIEEGEEIRELRCRHLFHRRCLDRWLAHRRAACPLCRDALVDREPATAKSGEYMDGDDDEEVDDSAVAWFACVRWWMW